MSKRRNITSRDLSPRRKNEDGKYLCRWCGGICPGRRTSWCSQKCLDEYWLRASQSVLRYKTLERDNGVCARCGFDTVKVTELIAVLQGQRMTARDGHYYSIWQHGYKYPKKEVFCPGDLKWRWKEDTRWLLDALEVEADGHGNLWQADHIVPVSEGGGCCGLENVQTLCIGCHKEETRKLHRRLKRKRDPQGRIFGENDD